MIAPTSKTASLPALLRSTTPARRVGAHRSRGWAMVTTVALFAAGGSLFLLGYYGLRNASLLKVMPTSPLIDNQTVAFWLARADIKPKDLAAAGVDSSMVAGLFTGARTYLSDHLADLQRADEGRASARSAYESTLNLVQSGLGAEADISGLNGLQQAFQAADQSCESGLAAFRAAALANLSPNQLATIATIRGNRKWELPTPYKVVAREESEWVALREAIANVRVAAQLGTSPSADATQRISDADRDAAVAAAKSSQDAQLATLKAAWATSSQN